MQSAPACTALVFLLFISHKRKPPQFQLENAHGASVLEQQRLNCFNAPLINNKDFIVVARLIINDDEPGVSAATRAARTAAAATTTRPGYGPTTTTWHRTRTTTPNSSALSTLCPRLPAISNLERSAGGSSCGSSSAKATSGGIPAGKAATRRHQCAKTRSRAGLGSYCGSPGSHQITGTGCHCKNIDRIGTCAATTTAKTPGTVTSSTTCAPHFNHDPRHVCGHGKSCIGHITEKLEVGNKRRYLHNPVVGEQSHIVPRRELVGYNNSTSFTRRGGNLNSVAVCRQDHICPRCNGNCVRQTIQVFNDLSARNVICIHGIGGQLCVLNCVIRDRCCHCGELGIRRRQHLHARRKSLSDTVGDGDVQPAGGTIKRARAKIKIHGEKSVEESRAVGNPAANLIASA